MATATGVTAMSPMFSVVEAAAAVRDGRETATALVERCFDAIDARNPTLNAFVYVDRERALNEARAVDAAVRAGKSDVLGALAGVPFGVKDLEHCAGMPTTFGSRWFKGRPPVEVDDIHVARLRNAGAIALGKTATPEFGAWAYTASPALGVTRNPWNTARTPGGSSGGSSAAVSAGLVPFCTASDGGGSIRTPAAFTGLVGLKCSYGRIPTLSVTHLAQNAVVGSLATTVRDVARLLDVMAGPDARDRTCLPPPNIHYESAIESLDLTGLRVGWTSDLGFAVVDPEVAGVAESAARAAAVACGAAFARKPYVLKDYISIYGKIEGVDKFVGIELDLWKNRLGELDPLVAPGWESAARATLPRLASVEDARKRVVLEVASWFDEIDVLMLPMIARTAFAAEGPMPTEVNGQSTHGGMAVIHGMLANLVNLPAISVPAGVASDGMPVGLQIVGPRYREDLLLAIARRFEKARPWPRHAP